MSKRRTRVLATLGVVAAAFLAFTSFGAAQESSALPEASSVPLVEEVVTSGWQTEVQSDPELVGVEWQGDPDAQFAVEVQHADGQWEEIGDLGVPDHGPDPGSAEARHAAATTAGNISEPVSVGEDVAALRVRLDSGAVEDVTLKEIDTAATPGPVHSALVSGRAPAWIVLAGAALGLLVTSRRRLAMFGAAAIGTMTLAACVAPPPPAAGIVSRDSWGGDLPWACPTGPDYAPSLTSEVVHHTASSNAYSPEQAVNQIRNIWGFHVFHLGYCDIAYNFIVDGWDRVYEGRRGGIDRPVIGAHAAGHNVGSSGIALLGNYTPETPAPGVIASLKDLMVWKFVVHGADPNPAYAIVAHNQLNPTECPGKRTDPLMPGIRADVRARVNGL